MAIPISSEQAARIRDDVRRIARRADDHEEQLEGLIRAAETDVRDAGAALAQARQREPAHTGTVERACSERLSRSVGTADAARRACVTAHEQHVAATRLLNRLDEEHSGNQPPGPRAHAAAVLVVDDVEDNRELVAQVLRDAGFLVWTAVNGLEALIAAHEIQPAVIVMDMAMPVLDGIEATRLIKATASARHAKVIAYTGNSSLADDLVQRLFVAVLRKPSMPGDLLAAVQKVASL